MARITELTQSRKAENPADLEWFWAQNDASLGEGDQDAQIERLRDGLKRLSDQDLVDFIHLYHAVMNRTYSWRLWAAAYAIGGGCSDDGFIDFRSWLISRGKAVAEAAMADPESLADLEFDPDEAQFEEYAYVALEEFETRSEGAPLETIYEGAGADPSNPDWEFDFDDAAEMKKRLPKLYAKFVGA